MKVLTFLGLIILGFLLVRYSKWLTDNTTRFEWPEKVLGPGGTYTVWKMIGVLLIAFAFYYLFAF